MIINTKQRKIKIEPRIKLNYTISMYDYMYLCLQEHHKKECPAYPVVCQKCNKGEIPRAKV